MNYKRSEMMNGVKSTNIALMFCAFIIVVGSIFLGYYTTQNSKLSQENAEYLSVIEEYSVEYSELESQAEDYKSKIKDYKSQIKDYKTEIKEYKEKLETTTKPTTTKRVVTTKAKATKTGFYLSDYERRIVECIVMGESGSEPYKGQVLVAQCILNACKKEGVQPSTIRTKYKYSGWHNKPSESVKKAVSAVFDNGYRVTNETVLYFYAPKYAKGRWHETQKFVCEVGGHRFFAEW